MMRTLEAPVLIVGTGIAGLKAALSIADDHQVILTTKRSADISSSDWAQGGISCVMAAEDSFDAHIDDTLGTGSGLCDVDTVQAIIRGGPQGIRDLEEIGVVFEKQSSDEYDLGREGGHTHRRVLHSGDITGHEVISRLVKAATENPNITLLEHVMAIDLVTTGWLKQEGVNTCLGAYFLDSKTGEVFAIRAAQTVLATGGACKVYQYTSNPDVATGDGIAMAWRAGLPVKNMEMVQFHPTCLFHRKAKSFLISEAVRGEGGILVNAKGQRFVEEFDERGSLAPRDIVARAIDNEIKRSGAKCVYLDITHKPAEFLKNRFPNIYQRCFELGIDMSKEWIPVVPAAHYFCGGVEATVDGSTRMPGLNVIGEASCTGLHGANRLASNSLLEGLVSADLLAKRMSTEENININPSISIPDWELYHAVPSDEAVVVEHNWNEVRTCMWDYVGIVRTDKRLERASRRIQNIRNEIREYYLNFLVTPDVLELRNLATIAELVIRCARRRKESRGLHYTLDYPEMLAVAEETVLDDPPGDSLTMLDSRVDHHG